MRIISGAAKGRRLAAPRGLYIRPTTDLVKEALFQLIENRLGRDWKAQSVLDLFAGTGGLGIEALSRGARHCIFVDRSKEAAALIERNLQICGQALELSNRTALCITELFHIQQACKRRILQQAPFQLIFADPPYETGLSTATIRFVMENNLLSEDGILVVEERRGVSLPADSMPLIDQRTYGDTVLWFYEVG